jgi:hypothetical protein
MRFKVGDRVKVTGLAYGDKEVAGIKFGFTGRVSDYTGETQFYNNGAYVIFDDKIYSHENDNGRFIHDFNLELINPKNKFSIGDKVVVVRGSNIKMELDDLEQNSLHSLKLFGRMGTIVHLDYDGYDAIVKFPDFTEGWGDEDECNWWGINKHNLRRVVTK